MAETGNAKEASRMGQPAMKQRDRERILAIVEEALGFVRMYGKSPDAYPMCKDLHTIRRIVEMEKCADARND